MQYSKWFLGISLSMALLLSGCSSATTAPEPIPEEVIIMAADLPPIAAPVVADPEAALEAVYDTLEGVIAEDIGVDRLKEVIGIMELRVDLTFARYSDPKGGLADMIIVKPKPGCLVEVREALYRYQDRRVAEFENFDVLNSLEIAQNAIIYEQGNYLILLMMADNEAAQLIIDQYIPL